jgi:hypothetical protein
MPTKRYLLTIVCILAVFCQSLYSKIILRGTITDNDSDPVQGALVKLIDQDYIKLINYSDLDLNLKLILIQKMYMNSLMNQSNSLPIFIPLSWDRWS